MSEQPNKIGDGGPAFPTSPEMLPLPDGGVFNRRAYECCDDQMGMSLRDYFAAKAIDSSLKEAVQRYEQGHECDVYQRAANGAYRMADAMLAAREAKAQ